MWHLTNLLIKRVISLTSHHEISYVNNDTNCILNPASIYDLAIPIACFAKCFKVFCSVYCVECQVQIETFHYFATSQQYFTMRRMANVSQNSHTWLWNIVSFHFKFQCKDTFKLETHPLSVADAIFFLNSNRWHSGLECINISFSEIKLFKWLMISFSLKQKNSCEYSKLRNRKKNKTIWCYFK